MKEIAEYRGQKCYIPTSRMFFIKLVFFLTGKDYTEEIQDFIRNEKNWSGVMTSARIQPFYRKLINNIGCSDGKEINLRIASGKNSSLFIHWNHFRLVRKPRGISFASSQPNWNY